MKNISAIIMIVGSVLFLAGLAVPPVSDVFDNTDDKQAQLDLIEEDGSGWDIGSGMVAAGGLIAAIGFALFTIYLQDLTEDTRFKQALLASAALVVIGAVGWVIVGYFRITRSPEEVVNDMNAGSVVFPVYIVLTCVAFIITGTILWRGVYLKWVGAMLAFLGSLIVLAFIGVGDMIPATLYPWMIISGIAVLFTKGTREGQENP